jgi:hypothetical protein
MNLLEGTNYVVDVDAVICAVGKRLMHLNSSDGKSWMERSQSVKPYLRMTRFLCRRRYDFATKDCGTCYCLWEAGCHLRIYLKGEKPEDFLHSLRTG